MAVSDDLNRLAAQDVVYLTRTLSVGAGGQGNGSTEVFRGRLREALNGDWVFHASAGQNGVVGFMLGGVGQNSWGSSESPATGLQITITFALSMMLMGPGPGGMAAMMQGTMNEVIVLTTLIPTDLTD